MRRLVRRFSDFCLADNPPHQRGNQNESRWPSPHCGPSPNPHMPRERNFPRIEASARCPQRAASGARFRNSARRARRAEASPPATGAYAAARSALQKRAVDAAEPFVGGQAFSSTELAVERDDPDGVAAGDQVVAEIEREPFESADAGVELPDDVGDTHQGWLTGP